MGAAKPVVCVHVPEEGQDVYVIREPGSVYIRIARCTEPVWTLRCEDALELANAIRRVVLEETK